MRTAFAAIVFASLHFATPDAHLKARKAMEEAKQTANPVRLLVLAMQIRDSLEEALRANPENVQVRLDLVRFYMTAPGLIGGDHGNARAEAEEIAKRDAALGTFARGYIFYRRKEYGAGRLELREAVRMAKDPATKALAQKWLGWLSQETQEWDEAFAMFEALRASDATATYEIARTSVFCSCELERGRAAVREYLRGKDREHVDEAKKLLAKLTPSADRPRAP